MQTTQNTANSLAKRNTEIVDEISCSSIMHARISSMLTHLPCLVCTILILLLQHYNLKYYYYFFFSDDHKFNLSPFTEIVHVLLRVYTTVR